jgi:hypothetical protein
MNNLLRAVIRCLQVILREYMKLLLIFIKALQSRSRGEKFTPGEFPTVHDGVRGMKFIHAVVDSNKEGNIWVNI